MTIKSRYLALIDPVNLQRTPTGIPRDRISIRGLQLPFRNSAVSSYRSFADVERVYAKVGLRLVLRKVS